MDRAGAAKYADAPFGKVLLYIGMELVVEKTSQYLPLYFIWLICVCSDAV